MSDKMREDAIREAACNVAVDEHFEARPHLMRTRHEERLFEAGFDRAWQAARTVPDEAVSILADVIRELENGFVRCETCGDQEDTATLDCMDELRRVHYMLSAAPEPKK